MRIHLCLRWNDDSLEARCLNDEKSGVFRCQLEGFHVSNYTEESWYNETVSLWKTTCTCSHPVGWALKLWITGCHISINAKFVSWIEHIYVKIPSPTLKWWYLRGNKSDWRKINRVSIPTWSNHVSSHIEELCYNERACEWHYIYIYIEREREDRKRERELVFNARKLLNQ